MINLTLTNNVLLWILAPTLFLTGLLLLISNGQKNLLLVILYLEMIILGTFTNLLIITKHNLNLSNYVYSFLLLAIAAAETALGLALIIKISGNIALVGTGKKINTFKH